MSSKHLGPYEILGVLGRGGMGTVFRGRHETTGDVVAIKALSHASADETHFRQRFESEIQALLKLNTFRSQSSFYTWLYRIAFNTASNRQRRAPPVTPLEPAVLQRRSDSADPGEPPSEQLLRRERALQIQAALGRLSDEFRSVLVLREIDGFDYEAIARVLNISVGTVRSRLHRARSLMREQLRNLHHGSTYS